MIVDQHVHIGTFPALEGMENLVRSDEEIAAWRTRYPDRYRKALFEEEGIDNSDALLGDMDRHDITHALVMAYPGSVSNDMVADAVRRNPDRLKGMVRLGHDQQARGYLKDPSPYVPEAVREIRRGVEDLGMVAVGEVFIRSLTCEVHPERVADDLDPILAECERYGIPIQFPTAWTQFAGGLAYGDVTWADEVAGRHPDVKIVLTKMGRGIGRYFDTALTVAMRNTNVYLDTVSTISEHLRHAVDRIGAGRIMFGSDWAVSCLWLSEPIYQQRMQVIDGAGLSDTERQAVLSGTACEVFGWPNP